MSTLYLQFLKTILGKVLKLAEGVVKALQHKKILKI